MTTTVPDGFVAVEVVPGFSANFGPIWVCHAENRIGFHVGEQHANPRGVCHGGALSTFADYQIAAVHGPEVRLAELPVTVSLSMDYLAPASLGTWVQGKVTKLRESRTLTFTQTVLMADEVAVARCNAVYRNRTDRR